MPNPWFRLWTDMPNDPKWRTIARVSGQKISVVQAVFLQLMVSASNAEKRGVTQCNAEDIASALDERTEDIQAILDAMQGRVMEGDHLTGWEKRQPKREDFSGNRVKAWRETQRNAVKRDVTQCNAPEKIREEEKREEKDKREPLSFDHSMVATAVMHELSLSGQDLLRNLSEIAKIEIAKGQDGQALADSMIASYRKYLAELKAGKFTQYAKKPANFFADGDWRMEEGWPWKEGQRPVKRKYLEVVA